LLFFYIIEYHISLYKVAALKSKWKLSLYFIHFKHFDFGIPVIQFATYSETCIFLQ